MQTTEVENFPGFSEGIMGPELMMEMQKQSQRFGTVIISNDVTEVDFSGDIKKIFTDGKDQIHAKAVIIATGASTKWLGVPGENELKGKGVSSCATCDGAFFRNKIITVVGGGDSAMEEASFLSRFASKLYVVHRRDSFRASQIMQKKILDNPNIEVIWNTEVKEIVGDDKIKSVLMYNNQTDQEFDHITDGLFIAIGHIPNTMFLKDQVEIDEQGYILTKRDLYNEKQVNHSDILETETSKTGVFVAGDVYDHVYRQAVTAAGSGCKSALDAQKYLEGLEF
jgi:thioredoxin reductase (NADPH)